MVKFVFAHFEKFDELELMHLNNVFAYFSKFHPQTEDVGQIKAFQRELNAQRELMLLLVKLLRDVDKLNRKEDVDAQTKILSHLYYILNKRNRESFMEFILEMIRESLGLTIEWDVVVPPKSEKESEQIKDEKTEEDPESKVQTPSQTGDNNEEGEKGEVEGEEGSKNVNTIVDQAIKNREIYQHFRNGIRQDMNNEMFLDMYFLLDYEFNISRPLHIIKEEEDPSRKKEDHN